MRPPCRRRRSSARGARGRRRIRSSGGARSACGRPRWCPARKWRSPCRGAGASRRRWRRRRWHPRPGRRARRGDGGSGGLVEQHGRAVREHLDVGRERRGRLHCGAADALGQGRGLDAGKRPDADLDHAAVRDHVDRRAPLNGADVERHEGDFREQLAVRDRLGFELVAQPGERLDDAAGGLDGVEAEMRIAAVGATAVQGDPQLQVTLVDAGHAQRRGLTDDRAARQGRRLREGLGQAAGAEGADLLVVGEDQGERRAQTARVDLGGEVGGHGEEAFHVAGAAGRPAVPLVGEGERVAPPAGLVRGHRVHVAGEHQPPAVAGRCRPHPSDQVGLGAVRGRVALDANAGAVQVARQEIGERQIAVPAGRVEGDQAGEQVGVGEVGDHGAGIIGGGRAKGHKGPKGHKGLNERRRVSVL